MPKKPIFNQEAAFKNIIGVTETANEEDVQVHEKVIPRSVIENLPSSINTIIASTKKEETRSKRVNFVIKPSVYNLARDKCEKMGISLNECVNQFLEKWSKE